MSEDNRKKTAKTRPGRNGGTLKAEAGPGRPKGSLSLTAYIKKALAQNNDAKAKILADAWIMQAAKGNGVIAKQLWDRIDGPVVDTVKHDGTIIIRGDTGSLLARTAPGAREDSEELGEE